MPTPIEEPGVRDSRTITADARPIPAGSLFRINCTVAGNVTATLESGVDEPIAVVVGYLALPYRVIGVKSSGTTATATYANLYV